ncbi:MAG: hypothetical protein M3R04_09395 [bacterium]|nr:hypothetical protein [bacterium]
MHDFKILESEKLTTGLVTQVIDFQFLMDQTGDKSFERLEDCLELQHWQRIDSERDRLTRREYENTNSHLVVDVLPQRGKNSTVFSCTYTHFRK